MNKNGTAKISTPIGPSVFIETAIAAMQPASATPSTCSFSDQEIRRFASHKIGNTSNSNASAPARLMNVAEIDKSRIPTHA